MRREVAAARRAAARGRRGVGARAATRRSARRAVARGRGGRRRKGARTSSNCTPAENRTIGTAVPAVSRTQPTTSAAVSLTPSTTSSSTRSKRVPVVAPSSRWATTAARTAAPLGTSCTAYCSGVPALAYCSLVWPSSSASAARSNSSSSATSTWITRERALLPWRAGATNMLPGGAYAVADAPGDPTADEPAARRWWGRLPGGPGPSEGSSSPSIAAGSEPPPQAQLI